MQGNLVSRRNFVGTVAAITVIDRASGFGIFSSAIVLAVTTLPTITSLSIDALVAVPGKYREGSYALGRTRWQTVWNVVLRSRPDLDIAYRGAHGRVDTRAHRRRRDARHAAGDARANRLSPGLPPMR